MNLPRPKAESKIQISNERVVVTEWHLAPGAETGWHRHRYDYVIVPQTSGQLLLESKDGEKVADLRASQSYFRVRGVEHNVVNANQHAFSFVEVELKK